MNEGVFIKSTLATQRSTNGFADLTDQRLDATQQDTESPPRTGYHRDSFTHIHTHTHMHRHSIHSMARRWGRRKEGDSRKKEEGRRRRIRKEEDESIKSVSVSVGGLVGVACVGGVRCDGSWLSLGVKQREDGLVTVLLLWKGVCACRGSGVGSATTSMYNGTFTRPPHHITASANNQIN